MEVDRGRTVRVEIVRKPTFFWMSNLYIYNITPLDFRQPCIIIMSSFRIFRNTKENRGFE